MDASGESEQTAVAGYHAVHLLAHSYLGSLWIALDQRNGPPGKPVLLRRVQLSEQTRSEAFQRMACAGRDAMALSHENVLPVVQVVLEADSLALAYEYVEAEPLRALQSWATHRRLAFPVEVSLRMIIDLLRGVRALHGTLLGWPSAPPYGGLSPDSILVSKDGRTRLCDPLVSSCATMLEGMSLNVSKLAYTAPEQAYATAPLAAASDIFTCGVLLWELLAGNRLLTGPRATVERKLLEHDLPSLRLQLPAGLDVSGRLVTLVERCLASDPGRRPQSPGELSSELEQCGHEVSSLEQVGAFMSELAGARFDQRKMTMRATPSLRVPAGRPSGMLAASSAGNGSTNGNGTGTSIAAGRRVPLPGEVSGSAAAIRSPVSSLGLGVAAAAARDAAALPRVPLPSRHPFARLGLPNAPKLIEIESTPRPAAPPAPEPIAPLPVEAPRVEAAPVAPQIKAEPVAPTSKAGRAAAPQVQAAPAAVRGAKAAPVAPQVDAAPVAPQIKAEPAVPAAKAARAAVPTVEAAPVALASKAARATAARVDAPPAAPQVVAAPVAPPLPAAEPAAPASKAARVAAPQVNAAPGAAASKLARAAVPTVEAAPVALASKAARTAAPRVDAAPVAAASKAARTVAPRVDAAPAAPRVEAAPVPPPLPAVEPVAPASKAARTAAPRVDAALVAPRLEAPVAPRVAAPVAPRVDATPAAPVAPRVDATPAAPVAPRVDAAPAAPVAPRDDAAPAAPVAPRVDTAPAAPVAPRVDTAPAAPVAPRVDTAPVAPRIEGALAEPSAAAPRAAAPARRDSIVVVPPTEPPLETTEDLAIAPRSEPVAPTPSSVPPLLVPAGTTTMIGLALPPSLLQAAAQFEKGLQTSSTPPSSNGAVVVIPPDPEEFDSSAPPGPPLPIRSLIPTLRPRPPGSGAPLSKPPSSGAALSGRTSGWSQAPGTPSAQPQPRKRAVFASLLATLMLAGALATALLLRPSHDLWSAAAAWAGLSHDSIEPPRAALTPPRPEPALVEEPVDGGGAARTDAGLPPASEDPVPAAVPLAAAPTSSDAAPLGDDQLLQLFALEHRTQLPDCRERLGASARLHNGVSPKKSQLQLKAARRQLLRGNNTEAQRLLCSATAHFTSNMAAWQALAELMLQLGDAAQAKQDIEQALKRRPNDATLLGLLGDAQAMLGDLTQARALWSKSLGVSVSDASGTRRLVQQFASIGDRKIRDWSYGVALLQYRRALVLSLGDAAPSAGMGNALRLLGQPQAALAWTHRAEALARR